MQLVVRSVKPRVTIELLRRQLVAMAENIKVTENLEALHKVLDTIADIPIVAPLSPGIYHRKPSH